MSTPPVAPPTSGAGTGRHRALAAAGAVGLVVLSFVLGGVGTPLLTRGWSSLTHGLGGNELVIAEQAWPDFDCSPAAVAMPAGGPAPTSFGTWSPGSPDPVSAAGAALGEGELSVRLVTRDDAAAYVYGITLEVFRSDPQANPAWVAELQAGGCGEVQRRLFTGRIDRGGTVIDRGVVGDGEAVPNTPRGALGADFTVSAADPAHIFIDVSACGGYYEFGVTVTYRFHGDKFTERIGEPAHPFKIMGMTRSAPLYVYDPATPPQQRGVKEPAACPAAAPAAEPEVTARGEDAGTASFPASLAGTWTGDLIESNGKSVPMSLAVDGGATTAQVRYPGLGCTGVVTLTGRAGDVLTATEHITAGPCTPDGAMRLWPTAQGRILLAYAPANRPYTGQASLSRG